MTEPIDCRSPEGVTVGLIDAIISIARIAAKKDLRSPAVQEALKDLAEDEDMLKILGEALYARSNAQLSEYIGDDPNWLEP